MLRTKLGNQFLKKRTLEARTKYNKQKNICVILVKIANRNYYRNLDINDNKKHKQRAYVKATIPFMQAVVNLKEIEKKAKKELSKNNLFKIT